MKFTRRELSNLVDCYGQTGTLISGKVNLIGEHKWNVSEPNMEYAMDELQRILKDKRIFSVLSKPNGYLEMFLMDSCGIVWVYTQTIEGYKIVQLIPNVSDFWDEL